ncbi:MAG: Na+/H+ antiporter [Chloroflexota bacterium]|nr:Na+/H+ antiporter [Chloroflexota bacterium]
MPEDANLSLPILLELLLAVLAIAVFAKRLRVPYTVALVLAGLVLGLVPQLSGIHLTPNLILTIFLPVLLFEGAYNLPAHRLRRNLAPIALLAVPGVMLGTAVTGALVHWLLGLDWPVALLFGAIISATDPVSVLALFRQLGAPSRLSTIVEGESLFNDGTAFVLFTILLAGVTEGGFDLANGLADFVVEIVGALALGSAIGYGGSLLLRTVDDYLLEITATFVAAYGTFLLAERFHFSPVIAVVIAGLFVGNYGTATAMSEQTNAAVSLTWEFAGFLANSLIFLLIGLALEVDVLASAWWVVLVAFVSSLTGRALSVYTLSPLLRGGMAIPIGFRHVMVWGGLRGALSLALALSLPLETAEGEPFPERGLLLAMTFGVVGASLLLQGLTMGPLLGRLGLAGGDERGVPPEEYGEMEDPETREGPGDPDTTTRDQRRG